MGASGEGVNGIPDFDLKAVGCEHCIYLKHSD